VSVTILNPSGLEVTVPIWLKRQLKRLSLLEWNRAEKKHQISGEYFPLRDVLLKRISRQRPLIPARNYTFVTAAAKNSPSGLFKFLGSDCSGSRWVDCNCEECKPTHPVKEEKKTTWDCPTQFIRGLRTALAEKEAWDESRTSKL
jgi:hypothetical protein